MKATEIADEEFRRHLSRHESLTPFMLDQVPFERTERAIRISREVFRLNAIVYQVFLFADRA